ncbi:hypothetical protein BU14_0055s0025 [Porphyra umbilicalis]|uniref:Uncharacterized protein n=1 Tax=Porphyra umbilicalis TaxID=2786 RepID=A0A1X6PI06_PORUM|nr:hypothetical protein BU14_0055s0025 [Porphyra umbilicalis]|eukprot:OSX80303.1 hypothetical protein BU14_0055s0025 [Porphyra umbilicalis]
MPNASTLFVAREEQPQRTRERETPTQRMQLTCEGQSGLWPFGSDTPASTHSSPKLKISSGSRAPVVTDLRNCAVSACAIGSWNDHTTAALTTCQRRQEKCARVATRETPTKKVRDKARAQKEKENIYSHTTDSLGTHCCNKLPPTSVAAHPLRRSRVLGGRRGHHRPPPPPHCHPRRRSTPPRQRAATAWPWTARTTTCPRRRSLTESA